MPRLRLAAIVAGVQPALICATQVVEDGNVSEKVSFYIRMGVGQAGWVGGTLVQSFASFEDQRNLGTYSSFTCSAEFNFDQEYAELKIVQAFKGESPLMYSVSETNSCCQWNDIAEEDKLYEDRKIW